MEDLSHLAKDSMWVTSQAAGNMMSDRQGAMSAPGSDPVDPLPPAKNQGEPEVSDSGPEISVGTDGKPKATSGSLNAGRPAWGKTTTPAVVRD